MTTAQAIRAARLAAGLTQRDLARLAYVSVQAVSYYEQGRRRPSIGVVMMLERVLGVELR